MAALHTSVKEISIHDACEQHFHDIGHDPKQLDITYENTQARERTQILMDLANTYNGIVLGTGDLSELALGWCTYNGDHMSMYGVNASIPKTLVRHLVKTYAQEMRKTEKTDIADVLDDICATMRIFYRRYFTQQFKRNAMPDGVKVGSICLSPRGDWRMPSDASAAAWIRQVNDLQ